MDANAWALLFYWLAGAFVLTMLPWPEPPDTSQEEVLMWLDW